ncbi:MAG TPA: rhodanese-like domain-containing protein [Flavobacterium sp.]|nr:rhodanese-like domain-containing protein [Flavobacterium sp.]
MKKIIALLLLALACVSCQAQSDGTRLVSPDVFQTQIASKKVQLIDVRTPKEFRQGHLEGARNIHLYEQDFASQIGKLNKKETVYVYCKAGGRSAEAVEIMKNSGFENIVELDGGTDSWAASGKPLVQ